MSVFIGSTTPSQRKCLDKEFHKLYSKKKAFMPRKQKIAIALNTCDVGIKGVKKEDNLLKKYSIEVQNKYKKYLVTWGKSMADAYLEREETIEEMNPKNFSLDKKVYESLKLAKQNTAKEIKSKGYGSDKYIPILFSNLRKELNKLGKVTDSQINTMLNRENIKTIWDEQKYIVKILNKRK
jgi:hypothetical protein